MVHARIGFGGAREWLIRVDCIEKVSRDLKYIKSVSHTTT